ncbi:MAG TPA: HIT family protein [Candidatus Saccharibacteria bacterium]|nr:HIT family protein [Candidatus Saccharibacteria bacterium]
MKEPTVFSRIIKGEIPAHKIYEDDKVIAFLDIYPVNEGHTLVVPKIEINHIWDLDDVDYDYLWQITKKISKHIQEVIGSPRVGAVVDGFGVPHAHIHLIPIYNGNDLKKESTKPTNDELADVANRLRM